eukprot:CAMPEP_0171829496 /NCGR_PEP_ID=MMETSP0992-20121227/7728_1 /TAXON_ID=483369 /ORGANISM="non described non described, Strain CCMP2098" /LENGTH=173 /DNA_ID=CAMNT_0012444751 /DNA_START=141 /DNA_END=661 /DNA_ORIENTATION=-
MAENSRAGRWCNRSSERMHDTATEIPPRWPSAGVVGDGPPLFVQVFLLQPWKRCAQSVDAKNKSELRVHGVTLIFDGCAARSTVSYGAVHMVQVKACLVDVNGARRRNAEVTKGWRPVVPHCPQDGAPLGCVRLNLLPRQSFKRVVICDAARNVTWCKSDSCLFVHVFDELSG